MNVPLTYRPQLQEQQQEGEGAAAPPAAEGAPPPDGAGDDDIINSILGDKGKGERKPPRDEEEPEPAVADEPEPDAPEDEEPAEDEEEADTTAEVEEDAEEATGDIAAARAAMDDGDIDKAFQIAFGKTPEELLPNAYTWTKWRAANDRERRNRQKQANDLQTERQTFHQAAQAERIQIHNTIEALKPYEKYRVAEQAFERDGDPSHLVTILEGIAKQPYNEIQKVILTKTRRSPTERALQERLQALEAKLTATTAEREQQQQQLTVQQQYQADLGHIRQHVSGPITKIPKFEERIYNVILKTRSAVGNTLTVGQAAAQVIRAERRRIENHPFVKKKGKPAPPAVSAAARTLAARSGKTRPALRRDSQNNGARRAGEESTDDIINDILKPKARRVG